MPIRWRLTLWSALVLTGVLLISGLVLQALLQRYLVDSVDESLRFYAARVHGNVTTGDIGSSSDNNVIHSKLPQIDEFASPGIYIQLVDKDGKVVVKSDNLVGQDLPMSPALIERAMRGTAGIETVTAAEGVRVRTMASPLLLRDRTLVLEVAQSMRHVDSTINQLRWALATSILIALVLATISGWFLVRGALAPVSGITRTARAIAASQDLARRVGYKGPMDELGELAVTFDRMLDRLRKSFEFQRYFVADASHELRSPLAVIRGNLDLLKRNIGTAARAESLQAIEGETDRMVKIVNDLLLLAEVQSGQAQFHDRVPLKDILLEVSDRAERIAGTYHVITIDKQEDLYVRGDAHLLTQALDNLVGNAIKYTPPGSSITLSLFRAGDWARLQVSDNGPGIGPEHLPHLFDRFYRVDKARSRAQGGTGLGLAIVKGIAEQHGGKATVDSRLGKGSAFTIWLKLSAL